MFLRSLNGCQLNILPRRAFLSRLIPLLFRRNSGLLGWLKAVVVMLILTYLSWNVRVERFFSGAILRSFSICRNLQIAHLILKGLNKSSIYLGSMWVALGLLNEILLVAIILIKILLWLLIIVFVILIPFIFHMERGHRLFLIGLVHTIVW